MGEYVGLDVSMKETSVCVVDREEAIVAEGVVATCPDAIAGFVGSRAPGALRVGLETGSLSAWLWRELKARGVPAVVVDARGAARTGAPSRPAPPQSSVRGKSPRY